MAKKTSRKQNQEPTDKMLPRLAVFLFSRPKSVFIAWLLIVIFGIASYTTLLRREGFPPVNIPIAIVNGVYIVNDQQKVDSDVAKPLVEIAKQQDGVKKVISQSSSNFTTITVQYSESTDAKTATKQLEETIKQAGKLPASANLTYSVPNFGATGPAAEKIDATVSFYADPSSTDTKTLVAKANEAVSYLNANKPSLVSEFFVQQPYSTATNPATGQQEEIQKTFDQFGIRENNQTKFYDSVIIGVRAVDDVDVITLDAQLERSIEQLKSQSPFKGYDAHISASFAPAIEESIGELQRVLIEGLIAVLVVGSIVITARASLITVISMITVITATLGLLYVTGYTLNVITLFGLILGLALIVDDTIIMVEAIDAARRKSKSQKEIIRTATRKVSRAMIAATSTAALSFLPLAFISGVLGSFIRAIPVTIISALVISLLFALVFIPLFSRYLLLSDKQLKKVKKDDHSAAAIEAKIAHAVTAPMRWAKGSMKRLWGVGLGAVAVGIAFVVAAGMIFSQVTFNLFPSSKDTNGMIVTLTMPQGSTIQTAQETARKADAITSKTLGTDFELASYYGLATPQSATLNVTLSPYNKRETTSKQYIAKLETALRSELGGSAEVQVAQVDAGPPASAFTVQVKTENTDAGYRLANDLASYLKSAELKRVNGSTASFTNVSVSSKTSIVRTDGDQVIQVTAGFNADDTTTLVSLAQTAVKEKFGPEKLRSYGLDTNTLAFDIGQEEDNQQSFRGLIVAFPLVLIGIYLLLVLEFRSLLQPLLIFLAIPFSLFGVTLSLFLSNNAFSFFTAMGFFALIGLSIKNTILLMDFANQSRRAGLGTIASAQAALEERFRPLIATSLTAVVSLIPLALMSPFWQGLALVLIGGLLSSTFLVVTVFPYYYLGGEYLRNHVSRLTGILWIVSVVTAGYLAAQFAGSLLLPAVLLVAVGFPLIKQYLLKRKTV